jgi:hypothetical protein
MPPPTVDEPVAQIEPSEKIRHCTRFTVNTLIALANILKPPGRLGLLGFASTTDVTVAPSASAVRTVRVRKR